LKSRDAGCFEKDASNNIRDLRVDVMTAWPEFGHPCQFFDGQTASNPVLLAVDQG
jgi:hypothetical protein